MKAARAAGVTFVMSGDAGVFTHGKNALEMELGGRDVALRRPSEVSQP